MSATRTAASEKESPPWEGRRKGNALGMLRRVITWTLGLGLLALIGYGLRPRPIEVESGTVTRGPLTVHVVEEGYLRPDWVTIEQGGVNGHSSGDVRQGEAPTGVIVGTD